MCSHELTLQIERKMQIRIMKMKCNETFWGLMVLSYHLHNFLNTTR